MYINDPYLNEKYDPIGLGQLINAGKKKMYDVGVSLRQRYDDFIGDTLHPDTVKARSTDYQRTKASVLLVLAGLFPPKNKQIWNYNLLWQPIPYFYSPRDNDEILFGRNCPRYLKLYEENKQSPKQLEKFKQYNQIFKYIAKNTGNNITTFEDVYNLYFGLTTEGESGFSLPEWTHKVYPDLMTEIAVKEYDVIMATTDMRRLASGYLIQKIIKDTTKKIEDLSSENKIYLYSAHENNLAQLLILLDVFKPHVPKYGSQIVLEVHDCNNTYGIKILYYDGTTNEPSVLKMPACDSICPIDQFESLLDEYIPPKNLTCVIK